MSIFDCCRPGAPRTRISRRLAALLMLFGSSMAVVAAPPVNTLKPGLFGASTTDTAIVGYDPVAYFTEGRPVPGSDAHVHTWKGAKWKFASAAHLEMFKAHPERYAPQYGGYCAYGVAKGDLVKIDPEAFAVIDGKLYLNYDSGIQKKWARDPQGYIKAADPKFPGLLEQ
ncbi:MAG: YHS domain-containing (seleno)protein [Polycyclovorans sp.]|jgi:YHS domain-containing protein